MNWFKKHWLIVVVLVAYTLIILLPPLFYGYVYPNNGDDTAFHLRYFDAIQNGSGGTINYLGQNIVGYPLVWFSNLTGVSIDALFLWFNFLVLWLVGIMAFILVGQFVDWRAGLLVVPMVMFMTPSTLNLYDTGAIYDLVTVGMMLPLAIFCFVNLWTSRKWQWALPLSSSVALVVLIHTMVLWKSVKLWNLEAETQIPSLSEFASVFVGYGVVLLFVGAMFWVFQPRFLKIASQAKILLVCLIAIIVPMIALMFTGFLGWSVRLALDVSIILPVLVGCLLGIVLKGNKSKVAWGIVCAFIVIASLPVASSYVQYNSAMKPIDLEVAQYVNSLDGDYYSCSPEVAPWVYDRFIDKEYKEGQLPHILRSEPMTSRTSPDSMAYWWFNNTAGYYRKDKTEYVKPSGEVDSFTDKDLEIEVIR